MGTKENAKIAMKELLGHVGIDVGTAKAIREEKEDTLGALDIEETGEEVAAAEAQSVPAVADRIATVIGADTRIDGNIVSQVPMEIYGSVNGNVTTTDRVFIKGGVIGDVHGNGIALSGCRIRGNIVSGTGITIDSGCILVGDVTCDSIEINGKVKGNVSAAKTLEIKDDGIVVGDVSAGHFVMSENSHVVGNVRLTQKHEENIDLNTIFAF